MSKKTKSPQAKASRREFLKTSSVIAGGAVAASSLGIASIAHAKGSDLIKIGLIGCGGRGTGAASQALNTSDKGAIKLIAMGDAFQNRLDGSHRSLSKYAKDGRFDVPKDRQFVGFDAYKKVLASDIDLVVIATPPGFRPIHVEAAVKAKKHVFAEKPVGVDAPGIRQFLAATAEAKKNNTALAIGLQRRHEGRYKETIKAIKDGIIGDIILTRVYWNGGGVWTRPRKAGQTEMEYQMTNWYYFNWLCGDHIVEQHIHNLDVSNWLMDDFPATANGQGGREVRTGKEHGQIFDHHFVEFTYPNGTKMYSQCRHIRGCWNSVSEFAHGTKGSANLSGKIYDTKGKLIADFSRKGGGGHQQEHHDLFRDIRAGKIPNEGEYGAKSTFTAIFGRLATYSGQNISWDKAINSKISLAPKEYSFDATPPVVPDGDGNYPIPVPGKTVTI